MLEKQKTLLSLDLSFYHLVVCYIANMVCAALAGEQYCTC